MNPVFEGQTKIKLVMNDLRSDLVAQMRKEIETVLHRSPAETDKLIAKIEETGKIRSQLNTIKKQARERTTSDTSTPKVLSAFIAASPMGLAGTAVT